MVVKKRNGGTGGLYTPLQASTSNHVPRHVKQTSYIQTQPADFDKPICSLYPLKTSPLIPLTAFAIACRPSQTGYTITAPIAAKCHTIATLTHPPKKLLVKM